MKKKLLISGAGGSLFPYLFDLLEEDYEFFAVDSNTVIQKIYPDRNIIVVPRADDASYEKIIEKIIKENGIEYYIPLIDEEILKAHSLALWLPGLKLISPRREFVSLCLNKYDLMKAFSARNISSTRTVLGGNFDFEIDFPLFIKPIKGRGSRGIMKVGSREQFDSYFILSEYGKKDVIVQECLEGTEYTVSVAVNNKNKIIGVVPKKILQKKGITQHALTERNPKIETLCKRIVSEFNPCGPFNVQLKDTAEGIKIFEVNPRFSTTSILSCEAGVNEFAMCMEYFGRDDVKEIAPFRENVFLYRRHENCFYE